MSSFDRIGTIGTLGDYEWTRRTGGRLQRRERRGMVIDLARVHAGNLVGRLGMLARVNPGKHAYVSPERLLPPDSALTRRALDAATRVLPGTLLNHSRRTYVFGRALAEVDGLDVDAELLCAAALLHDVGLTLPRGREDFTLVSARVARDVAEQVGLSTAGTDTLLTAITMHHSPRVPLEAGPVAHLLAAGAGVDVVGLRSWDLPRTILENAVGAHPREGFKASFTALWADEAARVPQGRAMLLRRYGAFTAAIAIAPFDE
ncbi:HD domain-containing protein [Intrasporangium sp. YIM S08009]|uniref:HD domain-containing protein n=1 Tax=Intrasporangium zincisolvens TaxID=3080018 RepID=UPI002B05A6E3|nr:HD domain-containing protein [Intrasporangium sp. YIM S08009]